MITYDSKKILFVYFFILSISISALYYTEQKVSANKFPIEISENPLDSYVQINCSESDTIDAIEKFKSGRVIQHAYIKSNDSYKSKGIPTSECPCKYMWTDRNVNKYFNKDNKSVQFNVNKAGALLLQWKIC